MSASASVTAGDSARRRGDAASIPGDYQHRAREHGFVVQRFWHAEKSRMLTRYLPLAPGERILDVGCGSGVVTADLARRGAVAVGVDGSEDAVRYAHGAFRPAGACFVRALADDLPVPPASVDGVVCMEVIEHLYAAQLDDVLREFARVVRPGGHLVLTTPNYDGLWRPLERFLDASRLVPRLSGDQHVSRHTVRSLEAAVRPDWEIVTLTTFSTFAPWLSMLGWRLAERVATREDRAALPYGCIVFVYARRRSR